VAALVAARIYPVIAVQDTAQPFLVYTMGTDERQVMYPGSSNLVPGDLEISCYARSYKVAKNLAASVRTCLIDFSGLMSANTSPLSSVQVSTIHLDGESDLEDIEPGLYRVLQRFTVWYYE
jgi:hypothetical protein